MYHSLTPLLPHAAPQISKEYLAAAMPPSVNSCSANSCLAFQFI